MNNLGNLRSFTITFCLVLILLLNLLIECLLFLQEMFFCVCAGEPAKRQFGCFECPGGYKCGIATVTPTVCGKGWYSKPGMQECTTCQIG